MLIIGKIFDGNQIFINIHLNLALIGIQKTLLSNMGKDVQMDFNAANAMAGK